jgi:hypothetical protein
MLGYTSRDFSASHTGSSKGEALGASPLLFPRTAGTTTTRLSSIYPSIKDRGELVNLFERIVKAQRDTNRRAGRKR